MVYNYLISILMITCSLLIPIAFSIGDTELGYKCLPNNTAFTIAYNQSRAFVMIDLIINTAKEGGFKKASFAWPDQNEWAYGLALCRGDVSPDDCKSCVNTAALTLVNTEHCPESREAIIWHDYCFLKYSDVAFFGKIDTDNKFSSMSDSYWNQLISSESATRSLMGNLSQTTSQSHMFYAHNTSDINDDPDPDPDPFDHSHSVTVYGVAQCTRDLSQDDCWACLNMTAKWLPTTKQGGRVVTGSCNMRYETYNFLND